MAKERCTHQAGVNENMGREGSYFKLLWGRLQVVDGRQSPPNNAGMQFLPFLVLSIIAVREIHDPNELADVYLTKRCAARADVPRAPAHQTVFVLGFPVGPSSGQPPYTTCYAANSGNNGAPSLPTTAGFCPSSLDIHFPFNSLLGIANVRNSYICQVMSDSVRC